MGKSALIVFLSLLLVLAIAPAAPASAQTKHTTAKKSAKKTATAKASASSSHKKAVAKAGSRKHTVIAARGRSSTVASLNKNEKLVKKVVMVHGRRKVTYQRVAFAPVVPALPPVLSAGEQAGLNLTRDPLELKSSVALVLDQNSSEVLLDKNSQVALPIASLTKLMTSMVVVESKQDMNEVLAVTDDDIDREKHSSSRLRVGSQLTRSDMLHIALMSSENRAASALGRNYPGGLPAFVVAMNAKAKALGMTETHYVDSTGLSHLNVASARDLSRLVMAAYQHPIIRQYSTDTKYVVEPGGRPLQYSTSNHLVENPEWQIGLQKTGYINEAGRCMVMQTTIDGRQIVMVFLDSRGKYSRQADADRVRKWLADSHPATLTRVKIADGQS
ncbi:D-alanyl-D-alanine endopeptidase [Collimonas pratensis]|uniref:D-alanyl-D-alanine carboxypeptidase family protein n=1 Tax=Collimonas pratensis TaxID=279113 RepID=A0A127Q1F9_9BURK|nr:D-alanyl-D-alanine endopeptidase [Collimonas pratensis]AMP03863.1 D-alanyl-D-alanine carboxypeptidase family protein [Collimonas pratensis]